jgi:hypothetical protein
MSHFLSGCQPIYQLGQCHAQRCLIGSRPSWARTLFASSSTDGSRSLVAPMHETHTTLDHFGFGIRATLFVSTQGRLRNPQFLGEISLTAPVSGSFDELRNAGNCHTQNPQKNALMRILYEIQCMAIHRPSRCQ